MTTKRTNPWKKQPAAKPTAKLFTRPTAKQPSTPRPRSLGKAEAVATSAAPKSLREKRLRQKSAQRIPSPSLRLPDWLRVGLRVKLTWHYDVAYGPGTAEFVGKVTNLDNGWIRAVSNDEVICRMPLSMVKVERVAR